MPESTVNANIDEAYVKLRAVLVKEGSVVISEKAPVQLVVKQGSLWGISPQSAKKIVNIHLDVTAAGTKVTASSKLASDWKNVTLVGCILAAVFAAVCFWLASDLSVFTVTREASFWSGIIMADDAVNMQAAKLLVNLCYGLAAFLAAVIGLEIAIVAYVHSKIDAFSQEALQKAAEN